MLQEGKRRGGIEMTVNERGWMTVTIISSVAFAIMTIIANSRYNTIKENDVIVERYKYDITECTKMLQTCVNDHEEQKEKIQYQIRAIPVDGEEKINQIVIWPYDPDCNREVKECECPVCPREVEKGCPWIYYQFNAGIYMFSWYGKNLSCPDGEKMMNPMVKIGKDGVYGEYR
jgi:hypothetical protein